jgi:hypothetical protein
MNPLLDGGIDFLERLRTGRPAGEGEQGREDQRRST